MMYKILSAAWNNDSMNWKTEPERIGLPLIALIAVHTAQADIWVDEEITLMLVDRWTAWELLTVLPVWQPHLPTYYLGVELLGHVAMLALSALSLPATVVFTMLASRAVHGDRQTSLMAGVLVSMSPFLAAQGGWLRMYAPITALLTAGLWLGLRSDDKCVWPLVGASLLHPFAALGAIWNAIVNRGKASAAGAVASLLPVVVLALVNVGPGGFTKRSTGVGHAIEPKLIHLVLTPVSSLVGAPHTANQVAAVLLVTLLIFIPINRKRQMVDWRLVMWITLPLLLIGLASHGLHPIYRVKYFGFLAPALSIAIADPRRSAYHNLLIGLGVGVLMAFSWTGRPEGLLVARRIFVDL